MYDGAVERAKGLTMDYSEFIGRKAILCQPSGLDVNPTLLSDALFEFQRDVVSWALSLGRACIFADCGMGKTLMQLEWCKQIPGRKLIVAPLAVGLQTQHEGQRFGIDVKFAREDCGHDITVTNYEMLHHFKPSLFSGVVLDESSILKSHTGKFRNYIIDEWSKVPYRLAATATPSPNDFMELGNHSEFVGSLSRREMLSTFFVHDGGETQKWRLKRHAEDDFWKWVSSWACMITKPSDLGYKDNGFVLPDCRIHEHQVNADHRDAGFLFAMPASSLSERLTARKATVEARCNVAASIANDTPGPCVVWCNLNNENDILGRLINGAITVKGADSLSDKEDRLIGFVEGRHRVLITKPSIAGFGMNWQHCATQVFVGLNDSYEQFYQAVRRSWRFGQSCPVDIHVVSADIEGAVVRNIKRKEEQSKTMAGKLQGLMRDSVKQRNQAGVCRKYTTNQTIQIPSFL